MWDQSHHYSKTQNKKECIQPAVQVEVCKAGKTTGHDLEAAGAADEESPDLCYETYITSFSPCHSWEVNVMTIRWAAVAPLESRPTASSSGHVL